MTKTGAIMIPADDGGCYHYRIKQPMEEYIRRTGGVIGKLPPGEDIRPHEYSSHIETANAGFILSSRQFSDENVLCWRAIKKLNPDTPIYMDFDDLLWNPHERSDYKPTPKMIENLDKIARNADRLICSTKPLQDELWYRYKKKAKIIPNMINDRHFKRPIRRNNLEKMRIIWAGSSTHQVDLDQIIPVVNETYSRYAWHFIGYVPPEIKEKVKFHPGVEFPDYMRLLGSVKAHVGIAPLANIRFNECKSNVKLLEYGALGMATVVSAVYPYMQSRGTLIQTGSKEEWLSALSDLENERTRQSNAAASQLYARQFSLKKGSDIIFNAYK